jgi:glycosyltransferase involved in cell wall biosynthesis
MQMLGWMCKFLGVCLALTGSLLEAKSVAIVTYHAEGLPQDMTWDPSSIQSGITGSEEAVIYMADELADLGYKVTVFGKPPANSSYSHPEMNPRYVDINIFDNEGVSYDVAISWRMPALGPELKKCAKKVYFWPHDRTYPLTLSREQVDSYDEVLWVSDWQRGEWIAKNPALSKFTKVCGNGINPGQFKPIAKRKNPYACIYGSNYGQGLSVLLDIWPSIRAEFPKATLDIYYGWRHFGFLTGDQEAKMRNQIQELSSQGVIDHGMVGHAELNDAYNKASFWTYPCIGTETFSITALRAQMSGAIPVVIEGSALLETVGSGYKCKTVDEYRNLFLNALRGAEQVSLQKREACRNFVLDRHTWKHVALRWKELFEKEVEVASCLKDLEETE